MIVAIGDAAGRTEYQGVTYYFCNPACQEEFETNPAAYVGPEEAAPSARRGAAGASSGIDVGNYDTRGGMKGMDENQAAGAKVIDPVCHMTVAVNENTPKSTYGSQTYYFCAPGCKTAFDKDPGKYVS
jgi:Cu+-exporting ATPase